LPSMWTPAGALGAGPNPWAASAGAICFTQSHGGASAAKNARNSAREGGRAKKSEDFKGEGSCTKTRPVDSGFLRGAPTFVTER